MGVLAREPKTRMLVDPARRVEPALRPQGDPPIACLACESDALGDEPPPDAEPARTGLDQQQTQLGDALGLADEKHRADDLAVGLGDPAALARRIELAQEIGGDLGDERFERRIVAVLLRIEGAVPMDDPQMRDKRPAAEALEASSSPRVAASPTKQQKSRTGAPLRRAPEGYGLVDGRAGQLKVTNY